MGIVKLVKLAANHHCKPPYDPKPETLYGIGTIWECDECNRRAQLAYDEREKSFCWQWMY